MGAGVVGVVGVHMGQLGIGLDLGAKQELINDISETLSQFSPSSTLTVCKTFVC